MKIEYLGGIHDCLVRYPDLPINAHTFLFFLGETQHIAIRPEESLCRLCFDAPLKFDMESLLSHVSVKVTSLFLETKSNHGLADLVLTLFARTDEDDTFLRDISYSHIPVQLFQHREILLPKKNRFTGGSTIHSVNPGVLA